MRTRGLLIIPPLPRIPDVKGPCRACCTQRGWRSSDPKQALTNYVPVLNKVRARKLTIPISEWTALLMRLKRQACSVIRIGPSCRPVAQTPEQRKPLKPRPTACCVVTSRAKVFISFGFVIFVSYWSESLSFKRLFSDMLQFMEGTHLGYDFTMCLGTYGWKAAGGHCTLHLSLKIVCRLQIPGQVL